MSDSCILFFRLVRLKPVSMPPPCPPPVTNLAAKDSQPLPLSLSP